MSFSTIAVPGKSEAYLPSIDARRQETAHVINRNQIFEGAVKGLLLLQILTRFPEQTYLLPVNHALADMSTH